MKFAHAASVTFAALVLAAAAPAISQPFGGPGNGAGCGPGHGPGMMQGAGPGAGNPAARAESRLQTLKGQLNLAASQEAAWNAYAKAVREQAADMADNRAAMMASSATAPERATAHAQRMQEHAAGMVQVSNALRGLYDVLNADQRALLDRNFTRRAGMGWGFPPG